MKNNYQNSMESVVSTLDERNEMVVLDGKTVNVKLNEGEFIALMVKGDPDMVPFKTEKECKEYRTREWGGLYKSEAEMDELIPICQYIFTGKDGLEENVPVCSVEDRIEKKTYTVYQTNYSTGYGVYEEDKPNQMIPQEMDILEQFEAEEGAEWFGYTVESLSLTNDDIEDDGYTIEQIMGMCGKERYDVLVDIISEKELYDMENGGLITECEEDKECEAYDVYEEGDGIDFTMEVKFRFTMEGGGVKFELVK